MQNQKEKHGAALDTVKAQKPRREKPRMSSGKKLEPDLNASAKGARRTGKGEERVLETWEVACSVCGKPFEVPFPPKPGVPCYGPCCEEKRNKGSF